MFDYLQKFNTLPKNLRDSVSSPAAMAVISKLEEKYKVDLASTVMKVMVKTIPLADLSIYFVSDFSLEQETAKRLTADLKEQLFFPVSNYLGYNASYSSVIPKVSQAAPSLAAAAKPDSSGIDKIIKSSGVIFPGFDLNIRFKNILSTYLKGIRSRVDTRLTLSKEIALGGLGLDHKIIDKIFNLCDEARAGQILPSGEQEFLPGGAMKLLPLNPAAGQSGLEKVRQAYEGSDTRDIPYDLKTAILKGEIKKPEIPANLPISGRAAEKLLTPPPEKIQPAAVIPISIPPIPEVSVPLAQVVQGAGIVAAAASLAAGAPTVNQLPKIERPPEKKPNLISKMFNKDEAAKEVPVVEINKPVDIIPPAAQPSMASLRAAAAKPIFHGEPIQPIIADVRIAPKVMGPIEELRYLDIVNFRRFGTSPLEAAAKVEAKIKLLEKDGYDKMINGVLAWRESPVNSLYLKMGQEALNKGTSFKQNADNYQGLKPNNFLIWEEIEAIIALNSRLMF